MLFAALTEVIPKRHKKRHRYLLIAFLAIVSTLVVVGALNFYSLPKRHLGDHTISIISGATRVETFRIKDQPEDADREQIQDFHVSATGKDRSKGFAGKLALVLLNPKTYADFNDTTCLIDPGIAFRLWKGQESVEVIVCFHCNQMIITTKDAHGKKVHYAYTELGFVRPQMIALAKEAFPDDTEIQALR